jgi:hypothetical protein
VDHPRQVRRRPPAQRLLRRSETEGTDGAAIVIKNLPETGFTGGIHRVGPVDFYAWWTGQRSEDGMEIWETNYGHSLRDVKYDEDTGLYYKTFRDVAVPADLDPSDWIEWQDSFDCET